MFDFDTVTPMSELDTATISFSEDWSPYEQKNKQREKISFATDIYAIGAVLYWLISGNRADASVLDDIKRQRFDFLDSLPVLVNKESPRNNLRTLLNRTLKREPSERSQNVEDLIE
jgi:serine/threonine protein kinase